MTVAVLAGGQSSRMGTSKAELTLRGQSVVDYLLDRWPGTRVILVTAPGQATAGAKRFDLIVSDPVAGLGPLRGILTALENAPDEIIVVTTIDMPNVAVEQLQFVEQALRDRPELSGLMLARDRGEERFIEPFPSAFRRSAATIIAQELSEQRRAVRGLLRHSEKFLLLDAPRDWNDSVWLNLTTPADVEAFNNARSS